MSVSQRLVLFALISIIIGLGFNQLIIQHYVHAYNDVASRFYNPWESYRLTQHFMSIGEAGKNIIIVTFLTAFLALMGQFAVYRKFFGKHLYSERHGTAEFDSTTEIEKTNMLQDPEILDSIEKRHGVITGAIEHQKGNPLVRYDTKEIVYLKWLMHYGHQHVLLIAPTGGGKGVGIVTPNLLNYPDSVFMYDMKGKDWETTAGHRSQNLNNICIKFQPTNDDGSSCFYNPMDFIIVGTPQEVNEAGNLALMLIDSDGTGVDGNHFKSNGAKLLAAAILHVIYTKKDKNLASVSALLSGIDPDTGEAYSGVKDWLGEMCGTSGKAIPHLESYAKTKQINLEQAKIELGKLVDEKGFNKYIKQIASSLYFNNGEKEVAGIISSTNTPLDLFNDPIIAENTSKSTINLNDFQSGEKPVSLYVVLMPKDQDRLRPLLRILLTQLINTVQATEHGKRREILFLLDEFATLKKMPVVANALATIRSFRARFLLVVQDLSQLNEYYDKMAGSIISNCGICIGYPSNDFKTNEQLAKWTGEYTYVAETVSVAVSKQQGFAIGSNVTTTTSKQDSMRTLLTTNEVKTMGKKILIFRENKNAIFGTSYNYREDVSIKPKLDLPITVVKSQISWR
jgi:type IV secretion system protein VirD4